MVETKATIVNRTVSRLQWRAYQFCFQLFEASRLRAERVDHTVSRTLLYTSAVTIMVARRIYNRACLATGLRMGDRKEERK